LCDLPTNYAVDVARKVEAKGWLIRGSRNKLNLTSMLARAGACPKCPIVSHLSVGISKVATGIVRARLYGESTVLLLRVKILPMRESLRMESAGNVPRFITIVTACFTDDKRLEFPGSRGLIALTQELDA